MHMAPREKFSTLSCRSNRNRWFAFRARYTAYTEVSREAEETSGRIIGQRVDSTWVEYVRKIIARSINRFQIMAREPLAEVKFRKPHSITKHGFPSERREQLHGGYPASKYCNMSVIHSQESRRNGMSVSDKSASEAAYVAMSQSVLRK